MSIKVHENLEFYFLSLLVNKDFCAREGLIFELPTTVLSRDQT